MPSSKSEARKKRKLSIRKRISGVPERPRLSVFRSARHIYAQVIDDTRHVTLCAASTLEPQTRQAVSGLKKKEQARRVGLEIAKRCLARGIDKVVFDRNGYLYHGRVSAVADGAREGGLKF
ncbi:MAG: 50S ribosomal protein L18 [Myxococcales bacterium]|nr:50S ribosomal protein L18 [Myxococcota bacterium]MDW8282174.1 50S ribosomal protein L18 [Myxococcales bacterium]